MYLSKLKNNNKGVDITLIGTNYVLVLIIICCAIIDLSIIEYSKICVVSALKQCEMYALAKHFDNEEMWNEQQFKLTEEVQNNVRTTFNQQFGAFAANCENSGFITGLSIANNSSNISGSGISVTADTKAMALKISVPKVHFVPKKILGKITKSPIKRHALVDKFPTYQFAFKSKDHPVSVEGNQIVTGAACKVAFIPQ